MRKQMKLAVVTSAAALLAAGASIPSFAASKGTWKMVDGEWYCYDSSGRKITNDWRLTAPIDDEDGEEEWFFFKSNGKRAEDEKLLIGGKTYFFDSEGTMLTGWVQESGDGWDEGSTDDVKNTDTYYCDEETGTRLEKTWVYTYAPSVDPDDVGSDDDEHYYYLKSSGKVATGKQTNVIGQTYFFDAEGVMLTGWVTQASDSNGYMQIWEDDDDTDGTYDTPLADFSDRNVYFCAEDGHMRKNKWINVYNNVEYGEDDDDNDKYWFWINSSGVVYIPNEGDYDFVGQIYDFDDGEEDAFESRFSVDNYGVDDKFNGGIVYAKEKKINSKTYFFNSHGQMISGFFRTNEDDKNEYKNSMYYFGGWDDGARKTGSCTVKDDSDESYRFYFASSTSESQHYYNGIGINGAKSGKLYEDGLLIRALDNKYEEKDVTIDGKVYHFIVNKSGSIQSSAKEYEEDDDVLIDARKYTFSKTVGAEYKSFLREGEEPATASDATEKN